MKKRKHGDVVAGGDIQTKEYSEEPCTGDECASI